MMAELTLDAQQRLDAYLQQVKRALRGHPSIDADEVERDVRGHVDAELQGRPEPVDVGSLQRVLEKLGRPEQWVRDEELSVWRRVVSRLSDGPESWRLAYLSFGLLLFQPLLVFFLGPLPTIASFVLARAWLAVMAERDEPLGARGWLVYPTLVSVYVPLAFLVCVGPVGVLAAPISESPAAVARLASWLPAPFWAAASLLALTGLGIWWVLLGALLVRGVGLVRATFSPFGDWFERRHATRLLWAGLVVAAVPGLALWLMASRP